MNMIKFEELSKDAQLTAIGMIEQSIKRGLFMGMDEGWTRHDKKRNFRKDLEAFVIQYNQMVKFLNK